MGHTQSKQKRHDSTLSDATVISYEAAHSTPNKPKHESVVTRPSPPREITHLSSLVDPAELAATGIDWTIRSPSGNLLGPSGFFGHPSRPLSLRERQERVREAVGNVGIKKVEQQRMAEVVPVHEVPVARRSTKRFWLCGG